MLIRKGIFINAMRLLFICTLIYLEKSKALLSNFCVETKICC